MSRGAAERVNQQLRQTVLASFLVSLLNVLLVANSENSLAQILWQIGLTVLGVVCTIILINRPVVAFVIVHTAVLVAALTQQNPFVTQFLLYLPLCFWLGRRTRSRTSSVTAMIGLTTTIGAFVLAPVRTGSDGIALLAPVGFVSGSLFIGAPTLVGAWMRIANERAVGVETLLKAERAESEARIAKALEDERGLMARELHDIASHHMTAVLLDARLARRMLPGNPQRAAELLEELTREAGSASESLHEVVGILAAGSQAPTAPQPTLADIPELLRRARAINPDIGVAMPQDPKVSPAVGLALYRIVQESLTNAHRYAPGAPIMVDLTIENGWMSLSVTNGLATQPTSGISGSGLGIQGMRMRCELLGGTLTAGPHEGGWAVRARLPQRAGEDGPTALAGT